ncbi:hypothetical protein [Taibaiella chishuiensis]|uniref:Parallel beta helix pectate lyase-like protein n=1 Tax=Taibaiella chishuiensis TaxID=1434707 RepID=A0A2P8CZM0_9BACT|nr:hypothetical protein [Taibaiella chishuiensis]PSK90419.1 hypothetical protein B0I18_108149 [Taibaiella chishuiensis]
MNRKLVTTSLAVIAACTAFVSCKKTNNDQTVISEPLQTIGQEITDTILPKKDASGNAIPIKGTMLAGKTYHIYADVTINQGDTLYIQPGVKVLVHGNGLSPASSPCFYVNGTLVSDGKESAPNWITAYESAATPLSNATYVNDAANDPAFKGYWGGFQCGPKANLLLLRFTHIEYTGGPWGDNAADYGAAPGDPRFTIYMNNTGGYGKLILEDSWFYGAVDDGIRPQNAYISIMRNTFQKMGKSGGESTNIKANTYGDMAYNLTYGIATNGLKTAGDVGTPCMVNIYNNTLVNCGYRQLKPTRNGSINTETNAGGFIFNNIIVNCKQGLRVTFQSQKGKPSDTLNTLYGNNLTCIGRGTPMATNDYMLFIEPNQYTLKMATDLNGYVNGTLAANGTNNGTNTVSDSLKYDPKFVNYSVAANSTGSQYLNYAIPPGADFHLASGSPAIGHGVTAASKAGASLLSQYGFPMHILPEGGTFGATITRPNADLGAFPGDGSGNRHKY